MKSGTSIRENLDETQSRREDSGCSATDAPLSASVPGAALAILRAANEPVWAVNSRKELILFNTAFFAAVSRRYGAAPALGTQLDKYVSSELFPHDYHYWSDFYDRAIEGKTPAHEFSYVRNDQIRHLCISCFPLDFEGPCVAFFARDVSDLRAAEEKAYEISAFSDRIFEASSIGVMSFDEQGICLFANSAASRLFGIPDRALPGKSRTIIPGWHEYGLADAAGSVLVDGREVKRSVHAKVNGRKDCWFEYRFLSFVLSGRKHLLLLVTDITASRQIEEDTITIMHELKKSNDELERFAYVASHDLQEPLRVIASYLQLLERRYADKVDDKGRDFISRTVGAAKRMQGMIEDLLGYSRVMTKGGAIERVALEDALSDALKNLAVAIKKSKAEIVSGALPVIMADKTQMARLFQNLLGNAIKFCAKDRPQIRISCAEGDDGWRISVKDNGIGIDGEYHKRIFHIFQRLHTSEEYSGSGIGLAVCQRIVERHGGTIGVESSAGEGATFTFTIPKERTKHAGA